MIVAVIPTMNEGECIHSALNNLSTLPVDLIIPVINGSSDNTLEKITNHHLYDKTYPLYIADRLGLDIPRSFGLASALDHDLEAVLFLDGDTSKNISHHLSRLVNAVKKQNVDMALVNCYPNINFRSPLTEDILYMREQVNRTIGHFNQLGVATPSHGPHCLSGDLARNLPLASLAIPPLSLAIAAKHQAKIQVVTALPHHALGSSVRTPVHTLLTAETIIGDCIQAINFYQGKPLNRYLNQHCYNGYHIERRFDLLNRFILAKKNSKIR